MSDDGTIAGDFIDTNHVQHGFVRATDGTITPFDPRVRPTQSPMA